MEPFDVKKMVKDSTDGKRRSKSAKKTLRKHTENIKKRPKSKLKKSNNGQETANKQVKTIHEKSQTQPKHELAHKALKNGLLKNR